MADHEEHHHKRHHGEGEVAVSIVTPSGVYPDDKDYHKAKEDERIQTVLDLAAKKLGLTNTQNWVVFDKKREINPARTFREEHLKEIVELEWHLREGGGGA